MKAFFKKLWYWLDNNKTILCLYSALILEKLVEYGVVQETPELRFLFWLLVSLGNGALIHHIRKGNFKWPTSDELLKKH